MSWKKMLLGEKMPDKNDPQYKEQYEKDVDAGRKTARFLKIDKAAEHVQRFACRNPRSFMVIIGSIIFMVLAINVYRIAMVCCADRSDQMSATQHQEQVLKQKRHIN
jgi:hypothetical protein